MQQSAGLLMYRHGPSGLEVLLALPGGPYFKNKDVGYWSIPKGLIDDGEDAYVAAVREFNEETGLAVDPAEPLALGAIIQSGKKRIQAWAFEGDCDATALVSNTFEMEWPPRSGRIATFPEIDRASWYGLEEANLQMQRDQAAFLVRLMEGTRA